MRIRHALLAPLCVAALLPLSALGDQRMTDTVSVTGGQIRGVYVGEDAAARAFLGVPFAAPPVGDLRWKPPRPVAPWEGVRDCAAFGPRCPQPPSPLFRAPAGTASEDCLYLNLWTPAAPAEKPLPVMVWIHGGGFTTGSGSSPLYDGAHLAREGAAVVTINYRLGPFGFLAHPLLSKESERGVSGNYGLLDQIAALEWVRDNIAAFGGDPGRVTIFGESAGAVSVACLLASPLAEGLFHRAIAQSGGAVGTHQPLRDGRGGRPSAEEQGVEIAAKLGIEDAPDALDRLRALPPEAFLKGLTIRVGLFGEGTRFWPNIDGYALPESPDAAGRKGRFHKVPLIAGSNADDGGLFVRALPARGMPGYRLLLKQRFGEEAEAAYEMFRPASGAEPALRDALGRLVTVSAFVYPARCLARQAAAGAPAYLYHFTRVPPALERLGMGAVHGAEIPYVFGNFIARARVEEADRELSRAMRAYWVNFARTGDPNGPGLPEWPRHDAAGDRHLELGDRVTSGARLHEKECDLMDRHRDRAPAGQAQ